MSDTQPATGGAFHAGERLLQARAGVAGRMDELGTRLIRDHMPDQHRIFFARQPYVVVGAADGRGQPWASILAGPPGFMSTPDDRTLRIDTLPTAHDPLAGAIRPGARVGLLGLEPPTRRRNRANGIIIATDENGFSVHVRESFGNCPRYIQARTVEFAAATAPGGRVDDSAESTPARSGPLLDAAACRLIAGADTLFIATAHPEAATDPNLIAGADVSHRGGRPGFVRVDQGGAGPATLTLPDFSGNDYYNTLGNIVLDPQLGLLFVDFDRAAVLQLAGRGEIVDDGSAATMFEGALRLLRITVSAARWLPGSLPLRWGSAVEPSPYLAGTGVWAAPERA